MCQKTITETMIGRKRAYIDVLDVGGKPDHKKSKALGDVSWNSVDCDKSIHAAMIKARFAETILKSQQKINLNPSNEAEKKVLQKKKANIEANLRAAEMELKMQRQKERQAARLAIDNMQRTVEWNDSFQVTHEFEKLIGVPTGPVRSFARDCFQW